MLKNWLRFIYSVVLFHSFVADPGEGGGSAGAGAEFYDDDLGGEDPGAGDPGAGDPGANGEDPGAGDPGQGAPGSNETDPNNKGGDGNTNEDINDLKTRLADAEKFVADAQAKEAVNQAVADIQTRHPEFNAEAVKEHLRKLNESDPERVKALNNPIGWENIYLNHLKPKEVNNDHPSYGRNVAPVDRGQEVLEKVEKGEYITTDDKMALVGDLL